MRILVLSSEYWHTGSSMRASQLAEALKHVGHESDFIPPPALPGRLRSDMVRSMVRYVTMSSRDRYDAIIAVKPYPSAAVPAVLRSGPTECILVIDVDDLDHAYREGWRSGAIRAIQAPFPRRADLVTYHNEHLGRYLVNVVGIAPERMWRLDQGVDTSLFDPLRPEIMTAAERIRRQNPKLVVNLCHFDAAADLEELLWAIGIAAEEDPEIRAIIVGGGPLLRRYQVHIEDSRLKGIVSLTGPLPQEKVVEFVAGANTCTVFYKEREANLNRSSLKLREYLAMGKKVVCTNVGELSSFQPFTYQTPPDVAEFADELITVVQSSKSKQALKGSKYVRSKYSWDSIAERLTQRLDGMS